MIRAREDYIIVTSWLCLSKFGVPIDVPHSEVELQTKFKPFTAAHLGSNTNQHADWTVGGTCIKSKWVYAFHIVQSVLLHLFKYIGGDNTHFISKNKMAATAVPRELCCTNFHENMVKMWVSFYNGNTDRSARVLFVKHPQGAGRMIRTKPTLGFDCIIRPATPGAGQTASSQPAYYPLINAYTLQRHHIFVHSHDGGF